MNQICSVIWNTVSGVYQAVAETGKSQGKGSAGKVPRSLRRAARTASATLVVGMVGTATLAQSLPTGGAVVADSGYRVTEENRLNGLEFCHPETGQKMIYALV